MKILNALTLFLLASAGLMQAQSDQQSLGDVARQNKSEKKAVRIISEDDFTPAREVSVTSGGSTSTSDRKTADSKTKTEGPNQPSSANSNSQVARLKTQLQQLRDEREGWQKSAKEYQTLLETEGDGFRRETYEKALSNDKQNAEICRQKIDQVQADLSKAEKDAGPSQKTASQPAPNQVSQQ